MTDRGKLHPKVGDIPCAKCGTTTSSDGDWYRVCGKCWLPESDAPVNWEASYHQACDDADAYKAEAGKILEEAEAAVVRQYKRAEAAEATLKELESAPQGDALLTEGARQKNDDEKKEHTRMDRQCDSTAVVPQPSAETTRATVTPNQVSHSLRSAQLAKLLRERTEVANRVARGGVAPHVAVYLSFELAEAILAVLLEAASVDAQSITEERDAWQRHACKIHDAKWDALISANEAAKSQLAQITEERDELRDKLAKWPSANAVKRAEQAEADLTRLQAAGEQVIAEMRAKAEASRLEASRIHSTVKGTTDAEERCRARAKVWDQEADRLSTLFRSVEATDAKVVAEAGDEEKWEPPESVPPMHCGCVGPVHKDTCPTVFGKLGKEQS